MRPLVTIEESTIAGMLKDKRYLDAFPFLQTAKNQIDLIPCTSCGKRARENVAKRKQIMQGLREQFARLPGSSRNILKSLVQAKKIRVIYFDGRGRKIQITY